MTSLRDWTSAGGKAPAASWRGMAPSFCRRRPLSDRPMSHARFGGLRRTGYLYTAGMVKAFRVGSLPYPSRRLRLPPCGGRNRRRRGLRFRVCAGRRQFPADGGHPGPSGPIGRGREVPERSVLYPDAPDDYLHRPPLIGNGCTKSLCRTAPMRGVGLPRRAASRGMKQEGVASSDRRFSGGCKALTTGRT